MVSGVGGNNIQKKISKLSPPKELRFDGNLSQKWERWKKEFNFYMTATESNERKPEDVSSRERPVLAHFNFLTDHHPNPFPRAHVKLFFQKNFTPS